MHTAAIPRIVVLILVLLGSISLGGAQQATMTQQTQTDATIDLPSAGGSELMRHVTEANFQLTARQDTGMTVLSQEQDNRYPVTMQGDLLFRNDGYQVTTDARVLERHPAEIQFLIDITAPNGSAAQVITPRTVQEQITVPSGTYDATVIVRVNGQAVYREQRQLQLDSTQGQNQLPQEGEQALEEQPPVQDTPQPIQEQEQTTHPKQEQPEQEQQNTQQHIQQLEQRIAMLEQELQRLRQMRNSPEPVDDTSQPAPQDVTGTAGIQDTTSAPTAGQGAERTEAAATVDEQSQTRDDQGPFHIIISFFR